MAKALGLTTDEQKEDAVRSIERQYFNRLAFPEGTTALSRKELEEILTEVATKWEKVKKAEGLAKKYKHGPPKITLPFVGDKEAKAFARKWRSISPAMQKIFPNFYINEQSWLAWRLSAVLEKPIKDYSADELYAFSDSIEDLFYIQDVLAPRSS